MPEQNILFKLTADEKQALAAYRKLTKGMTDAEKKAAKLTTETKKVDKAHQQLEKQALRTYEKSKTAVQRYTDKVRMLDQAKKRGILTENQHAQALRYTKREMERVGAASRRAAMETRGAFGAGAIGRLARYAGGLLSIATAIRAGTAALRERQEVSRAAAERQRESEIGLGSLGQLALGDPQELKRLVGLARQTYQEGGATTEDEAGRFIFSLASAGALQHRKMFSDLRSRGLIEQPGEMAKSAKTLVQTMGEAETGGMPALVSKSFAASAYSPASAEAILAGAARSGTSAAEMGTSDEALLAATAIVATAKGSAEEGGTYLAQMMRTLKQKGSFKGKTLRQSLMEVEKIKKGTTPEEFKEWFGRAQGQEAFEVLMGNLAMFDTAMGDVRRAEQTQAVRRIVAASDTVPELRNVRLQRQAVAGREMGELAAGRRANIVDTFLQEEQAERRRGIEARGGGEFSTYFTYGVQSAYRYLAGDQAMLKRIAEGSAGATPATQEAARQELLLERIANGIDSMNQNTQQPTLGTPGVQALNTKDPGDK